MTIIYKDFYDNYKIVLIIIFLLITNTVFFQIANKCDPKIISNPILKYFPKNCAGSENICDSEIISLFICASVNFHDELNKRKRPERSIRRRITILNSAFRRGVQKTCILCNNRKLN